MPEVEATLAVLVKRAPDLPGQWVAHCLHLDVMSQGDSPQHAMAMIAEAVFVAITDDLEHGLDPRARKPAGEDSWREFFDVVRLGEPWGTVADEKKVTALAALLKIAIPAHAAPEVATVPPAWQIATMQQMNDGPISHR